MLGIPKFVSSPPEAIRFHREYCASLRPRDAGLQSRDRLPAVISRGILCCVTEVALVRIIEAVRRDSNHSQLHPIDANRRTNRLLVACKKLLPESVADYCHGIFPPRILTVAEPSYQRRLCPKDRAEIPGRVGKMRSLRALRCAQIDVELLDECGIGEIGALLLPPLVKFLCAAVGRKKCSEGDQTAGVMER